MAHRPAAKHHWRSNLPAGLTVGLVALPLAMALAIASGVQPEQGLYTAIIAGARVALFGGSRLQIAGPTGAFVGVILASLLFMRRMSVVAELQPQSAQQLQQELQREGLAVPKGVMIYSVNGPFFFAAVDNFARTLRQAHTHPDTLIFRMGGVPIVDITGLQALEVAIRQLQKHGTRVMLCELAPRVEAKLRRAEVIASLGEENVQPRLLDAIRVLAVH